MPIDSIVRRTLFFGMHKNDSFRLLDESAAFAAIVVLVFLCWFCLHLERLAQ